MPRAFIAACPFRNLYVHIRDNPQLSPFACWTLGIKHLPNIKLDSENEACSLKSFV